MHATPQNPEVSNNFETKILMLAKERCFRPLVLLNRRLQLPHGFKVVILHLHLLLHQQIINSSKTQLGEDYKNSLGKRVYSANLAVIRIVPVIDTNPGLDVRIDYQRLRSEIAGTRQDALTRLSRVYRGHASKMERFR
jgi:hypothetical protein